MRAKRKGTDVSTPSTAVSVVSVNLNTVSPWEETTQMLKEMRLERNDNIMNSLQGCFNLSISLENEQEVLMRDTDRIKSDLEDRIQQAREACREESDDLYRLQLQLQRLQADKEALHQELEEMDTLQHETREHITSYKEEAKEQVESIDQIEAERMRQVPRLKHQISLYATTTGIKWDFDQEDVLAGQVADPVQGGLRRFSIDPREHSKFEVANHLWSLMEGNPSPAVIPRANE